MAARTGVCGKCYQRIDLTNEGGKLVLKTHWSHKLGGKCPGSGKLPSG